MTKMELIHSNVMGPIPHTSYDGQGYAFTLIDDSNRNVIVSLMGVKMSKNEPRDSLESFKAIRENQTESPQEN